MNRATPSVRPCCTANVWCPRKVPSAATSRNHRIIPNSVEKNPNARKISAWAKPWKYITPDVVSVSSENDVRIGQGEGSTM